MYEVIYEFLLPVASTTRSTVILSAWPLLDPSRVITASVDQAANNPSFILGMGNIFCKSPKLIKSHQKSRL